MSQSPQSKAASAAPSQAASPEDGLRNVARTASTEAGLQKPARTGSSEAPVKSPAQTAKPETANPQSTRPDVVHSRGPRPEAALHGAAQAVLPEGAHSEVPLHGPTRVSPTTAAKAYWSLRRLTLTFGALAALASALAYLGGHGSASATALAAWSGVSPERVGLAFGAELFFPAVAFLLVYKHRDKPLDAPPGKVAVALWLLGALTALCAWPCPVTLAWCFVTTAAAGLPMFDRVVSQALGAPVTPTLLTFKNPPDGRTPLRPGPFLACLTLTAFRFPMIFLVFNPGFFPALYARSITGTDIPLHAREIEMTIFFLLMALANRFDLIFRKRASMWFFLTVTGPLMALIIFPSLRNLWEAPLEKQLLVGLGYLAVVAVIICNHDISAKQNAQARRDGEDKP